MKKIIIAISITVVSLALFFSCADDYMDTVPTASVSPATLFSDAENAKMAINGMARVMVNQYNQSPFGQVFCGEGTVKFINGEYMGENFSRPNLASGWTSTMTFAAIDNNNSVYTYFPWHYYYILIGNANEFMKAEIGNAAGNEKQIDFLKAQALVFRAYSYTQLVQFFCPRWVDNRNDEARLNCGLVLRTEDNYMDRDVPLSSANAVYAQIYADLDKAIALFTSSGLNRTNVWEPNINVAYATYARAAITRQDYAKAAEMAAKARSGYALMSNAEYNSGFNASNKEWIWGSYGGSDQTLYFYGFHSYMAYDADASIMRSYPVTISRTLYDKIPATDIRKNLFLDPEPDNSYSKTTGLYAATNAFALKVFAEHPTMTAAHRISAWHSFKFSTGGPTGIGYINHFRSAEMYLIEAEAKYFQSNEGDARSLMNALVCDSGRDSEYNCTATGAALLAEIKFYRAVELWGEGFDWPDKKRYNEAIVRKDFNNGGSFYSTVALTLQPDYKNNWVYVTPLLELQYNKAIGGGQ